MKSLCFVHPGKSYLPEISAYRKYFEGTYQIDVKTNTSGIEHYDIVWFFMGFYQYKAPQGQFVVHEFASLSMAPVASLKDWIKRQFLPKPALRVFQNKLQYREIGFDDGVPVVFRNMGVPDALSKITRLEPEYDLIYVGSMHESRRIGPMLSKLLSLNKELKVVLLGVASEKLIEMFKAYPSIKFVGAVPYEQVPGWLAKARYALNSIPMTAGYEIQASTKMLEYAAAGLPVISMINQWTRDLQSKYRIECADIDKIDQWPPQFDVSSHLPKVNDDFLWQNVIQNAGFEHYLP
ncbi:glycosyltransferase [Rheinheimera sp.]|uniref:glycosyltransferase n=1 Tax=Rheinheimera sp. TaxID=1869214 RepID=UPI003AF65038